MFRGEVLEAQFEFPFGDGAVNLVNAASEEARNFRHNFIGTEHLLLGYSLVRNPVFLKSLGIDVNKVRASIEFIVGRGDRDVAGDPDFTPRSKTAISLGTGEARELGDESLETDHIMLGLVKEGEGMAAAIIDQLGLKPTTLRQIIIAACQERAKIRKPNSLEILSAFLADPNQDPAKKLALQGTLDNLTGLILPPS